MLRSLSILVLCGAALAGPGDTPLEAESGPPPAQGAEAIAATLNPYVLTSLVSERLLVEVDWVAGYRPSYAALAAAESLLREHCEAGRRIEFVLDDEIPRSSWQAHPGRAGLERLVAGWLDADPTDWRTSEVVYVLYVPDSAPWYEGPLSGFADRVLFERAGKVSAVRSVLLFTDEIRRDASLWITKDKVERATLIHELGHVLGLTHNPDHMQAKHPGHCSVARCVMHRPGWRAAWVNGLPAFFAGKIPDALGRRCASDIESSRRLWEGRASASPQFVRRLKSERLFLELGEAEAWRALRVSR